jgi:hypothetical protein
MRLCVVLLFATFTFVQSQPPTPTPTKTAHANQKKTTPEQSQRTANDEATKQLTSAINQLSAVIAARNQQQSGTPYEDKSPAKWWTIANTILITVFTGALAGVAVFQWLTMRRQADIADRQTGIIGKQAEIAADQLAITKAADARYDTEKMAEEIEGIRERRRSDERYTEQLELAKENTTIAKKAADAANRNIDLIVNKEKARLRIEMIDNLSLQVGQILTAEFKILFHGFTDAFSVETEVDAGISKSRELPIENGFRIPSRIHGLPSVVSAKVLKHRYLAQIMDKLDEATLRDIQTQRRYVHCWGVYPL